VPVAFSIALLACAVCGAAEKALPSNGTEIAFEGRKRTTLELRAASFETRRLGGASVHVAPEIVLSPTGDVVVSAGASFPLVQEMRGYRATAPVLLASVGVDF
jgi:hypothetical protein